jgi:hypothetical protein
MPCTTGHSCKHPRAPDNMHLSAATCPITVWHYYFTKGTHIIIVITLKSDKDALVKAGFSMRDSVQHGPQRSTPNHLSRPRGFLPLRKAFSCHAAYYSMMGHDDIYQGALLPRLSDTVHRMVQEAGSPIHISPHVGRLSIQVKQSEVQEAPSYSNYLSMFSAPTNNWMVKIACSSSEVVSQTTRTQ